MKKILANGYFYITENENLRQVLRDSYFIETEDIQLKKDLQLVKAEYNEDIEAARVEGKPKYYKMKIILEEV